ncbi:MAG: PAS domain S-box protein, partial [Verrucomicrobiota bacterium]
SLGAVNLFFVSPGAGASLFDLVAQLAFLVATLVMISAIEIMRRSRARLVRENAERERTEIELAQARDLLSTTLASIGDAVIVTDMEGKVTFLNPEAERLTGWKNEEAKCAPLSAVFKIINERTRLPVQNPVDKVLRTGKIVGLANHTLLISKDGTETPIDDSAAPICRPGGPLFGVVLVFREVTESRKAHNAAARLAAIVEHSGDVIITKDLRGNVLTWNGSAERLFGYRADEMVGRPVTILFPPDRLHEEDHILDRLRQGQPVERLETFRVAKDGRPVPVLVSVSPLRNSEGELVGASKVIHDMTDLVAAREALMREKELLATTLASIGDAVIVTDPEGRVTFLNSEAERLTQWSHAEACGQSLNKVFRIVNEHTREPVEDPVEKVLRLGTTVGLANHTVLIARDGTETPIDDSAAPIRRAGEPLYGVVLVFRDFTARKQAENALKQSEVRERERAAELQAIMDSVPALIWIARDTECRVIEGNQASFRFLRMSGDRNPSLSAPEEERPTHFSVWSEGRQLLPEELPVQRAARGEEVHNFEEEVQFQDGSSRFLLGNATPLRDLDGKVRGAVAAFVDITELKAALEALRAREEELEAVINRTPFMLTRCSRDLKYRFVSRAYAEMIGWKPEEVVGKPIVQVMGEEGFRTILPFVQTVLDGERAEYEAEIHFERIGKRYLHVVYTPDKNDRGEITGWIASILDITERKEAEQALRKSEALLSAVLRQLPLGLGVMDKNGQWLVCNAVMERFVPRGIPSTQPERISRWRAFDAEGKLVPKEDWPGQRALRGEIVSPGLEMVFTDDQGQEHWMRVGAAPLRDEAGGIIGATCVVQDIDQIKLAQDKIAEQGRVLELINDGIYTLDDGLRVTSWNEAAERMFGYKAEEMLGRKVDEMLRPKMPLQQREKFLERLLEGEVLRMEIELWRKSNEKIWVDETALAQRGADGTFVRFVLINRDISERKKIEEALLDAHAQLSQRAVHLEKTVQSRTLRLNEMVGDLEAFSYSLVHDMRAPLRAMQSFARLLADDCAPLGPSAEDYVKRITTAAERMDRLIRDGLNYSRILRGDLRLETVDVGALLRGMLESYPAFQPPHAVIELEGTFHPVLGNEPGLVQCLSNLIGNALKFVRPNSIPHVRIWSEPRGNRVRLCFRDNGIGIDPSEHEKIFQIFYRLDATYEGTGIGLAIVKKAVERMGGRVGLESQPGNGSTFWIELSAANEPKS